MGKAFRKKKGSKNAAANKSVSGNLNGSISTYGRLQSRLCSDLPNFNWLPSDDSCAKAKIKNAALSDITNSMDSNVRPQRFVQDIFDSDSDDDFKPVSRKQSVKNSKIVGKSKRNSTEDFDHDDDSTVKSKKTKSKTSNSKRKNTATSKNSRKKPKELPKRQKVDSTEKDKNETDDAVRRCLPVPSPAAISVQEIEHERQCDPSISDIFCSPQPECRLITSIDKFSTSCTEKDESLQYITAEDKIEKESLQNPEYIAERILSPKSVVGFHSSVVHHAANIEMTELNPQGDTSSLLHKSNCNSLKILPAVTQSTPIVTRKESHFLKPSKEPQDMKTQKNCEKKICKPRLIARNKLPKNARRKPPTKKVQLSKLKWNKSQTKDDNDSILHQIMVGNPVNFRYNFLEDSKDAYFVDDISNDAVTVKIGSNKLSSHSKKQSAKKNPETTSALQYVKRPSKRKPKVSEQHSTENESSLFVPEQEIVTSESSMHQTAIPPAKRTMRSKRTLRRKPRVDYKLMNRGASNSTSTDKGRKITQSVYKETVDTDDQNSRNDTNATNHQSRDRFFDESETYSSNSPKKQEQCSSADLSSVAGHPHGKISETDPREFQIHMTIEEKKNSIPVINDDFISVRRKRKSVPAPLISESSTFPSMSFSITENTTTGNHCHMLPTNTSISRNGHPIMKKSKESNKFSQDNEISLRSPLSPNSLPQKSDKSRILSLRTHSPRSHCRSTVQVQLDRTNLDQVKTNLASIMNETDDLKVRSRFNPVVDIERISNSVIEKLSLNKENSQKSIGFADILSPNKIRFRDGKVLSPMERVLLECCQEKPISFDDILQDFTMRDCVKLGEGVYGEVFGCKISSNNEKVALKIIPIEGSLIVNNERQKTFEEILPEIVSSKELSDLSNGDENSTDGFITLHNVRCIKGKYPTLFVEAWDAYDEEHGSENDRPDVFEDNQLYILLQFADGGTDIEHYKFRSSFQAFAVVQQVCAALAVAEKTLEFEHRDLHWGNILIAPTKLRSLSISYDGDEFEVPTHGVKASIIDFTVSRLSQGGVTVFQDLSDDYELFEGDPDVDYQYEIYRIMKEVTHNDWSSFMPKTNIYWLHYLVDKFLNEVKYLSSKTSRHRSFLAKLRSFNKEILNYDSCLHALSSLPMLSLNL